MFPSLRTGLCGTMLLPLQAMAATPDLDPASVDLSQLSDTEIFCPSGSAFDPETRMCTFRDQNRQISALGPFPPEMVRVCEWAKGGRACRSGVGWKKDFATAIRGKAFCPRGTRFHARRGVCFEGEFAYGPFPGAAVRACLEAKPAKDCLLPRQKLESFPERPGALFCPVGWTYSEEHRLCVSEHDQLALGPFPEAMVTACQEGMGDPACTTARWKLDWALALRGTEACPNGSTLSESRGVCVTAEHAFGPFAYDEVKRCMDSEDSEACLSPRWSSAMFPPRDHTTRVDLGRWDLPPPQSVAATHKLWATNYFLPYFENGDGAYPLRDLDGISLGATLTRHQWCRAGMEGSVRVRFADGKIRTFNYAGQSAKNAVNCSDIYPKFPRTGWVKFRTASGEFGDGVEDFKLIPYRTIAVDPAKIPYGSVVYIPSARGASIELPNGEKVTHDGYFYAADTGGGIKGNHIDVFTGLQLESPFWWVLSTSRWTFEATIVTDLETKAYFKKLHTQ